MGKIGARAMSYDEFAYERFGFGVDPVSRRPVAYDPSVQKRFYAFMKGIVAAATPSDTGGSQDSASPDID